MTLPTLETINLLAVMPVLTLVGWGCLVLVFDLFIPATRKYWTAWLTVLGLGLTAIVLAVQAMAFLPGHPQSAFNGMLTVDGFALFLQAIFLLAAFVGVLMALNYLPRRGIERGEYYTLLIFTTTGMMFMSMAADLVVVFLSLELLSIPLYILSGFARPRVDSEESAMKYFLLGAFASGFLVYGIALVYGGTQTTALSGVVKAISGSAPNLPLAIIGLGLILVGLCFKVAAVPFHMWTPDVYQGAPTPVTAFMSVGAKAGGFAAMLRVLVAAFPAISGEWGALIAVIALLTMIVGNFVAISQTDIKRMLAYSSIAHAGYILVALAAAADPKVAPFAVSAALFYLLTYTFTNLGAFALVIAVEKDDGTGTLIDDFAGLGKAKPMMAAAMAVFMLSLVGFPPTAGMVGKWFVFQAAIQASNTNVLLLIVTIVGILTSVVSAFYYMRVIVVMYFRDGAGNAVMRPPLAAATAAMAIGTLALGVIPAPIFQMAQQALLKIAG